MKKALSLLLALALCLAMLPISALATEEPESGTCGDNVTWAFDLMRGQLTISGTGDMANYTESEEVPWSSWCIDIKYVVIEDGVTSIGDYAFYKCEFLTDVHIANSVTRIGNGAFRQCKRLPSIEIPASVTSIGQDAFSSCAKLSSIEIPASVTSIGNWVIYECTDLREITFAGDAPEISELAFQGACPVTIRYPKYKPSWQSVQGKSYGAPDIDIVWEPYLPEGATDGGICGENLGWFLGGNTLTISGTGDMQDFQIQEIDEAPWSSYYNQIETVLIEEGATSIGNYAFFGYIFMTSVQIPISVNRIGKYAFAECQSLTSIEIPTTVTSIGDCAFSNCSYLTSIEIPASVTSIGQLAFTECIDLRKITFVGAPPSIGENAFRKIENVTILYPQNKPGWEGVVGNSYGAKHIVWQPYLPDGDTDGGSCGENLDWLLVGNTLTISGTGDMHDFLYDNVPWSPYREQIETVEIEEGVTTIGNIAFYQCGNLTHLTIANTVTSIGSEAFAGCAGLTSITIPESVRDIGESTFADCTGLQEIRFEGDVPGIGPAAFENVPRTAIGYYPANNESWANYFEGGTAPRITWKAYCKDNQHIWSEDWSCDENQHWHKCSNPDCDAKVDEAFHDYGDQGDTCACGYERAHVHRLTFVEGKEATCTEEGLLEHYACSGCKKTFADKNGETELETVVISKKDHKTEVQGKREATCTEEGYTGDTVCTVCQQTIVKGEPITMQEHQTELRNAKEATCTEEGYTGDTVCTVCEQTIEKGTKIPVSDHNYVDGTCTACGEKDPDYQVPSTPITPAKPIWQTWLDQWLGSIGQKCRHTYTEKVTPPTCEEKGYTTHTCTKCGHTYQDTYTKALGHHYENGECTNCGKQQPASVPSTPVKPGWWPSWWK